MNKHFGLLAVATLILGTATSSKAQMNVYVAATADDSVGGRLVYAMKEKIRRSAGMTLVERDQDGRVAVHIVTLDPDSSSGGGRRTIYSVVWTAKTFHDTPVDLFLNNSVGLCGTNKIQECAEDLVADTDRQVSQVKSWIQGAVDGNRE